MKLLHLTERPAKKTENLSGSPICPIKVGWIAVIAKNGRLYHTSKVIAVHECTEDHIHFETLHTHYHMSISPFQQGAMCQYPVCMAA